MAVSYMQVFHKISNEHIRTEATTDVNTDAEEGAENTSEENRETDQDEDSFKLVEKIAMSAANSLSAIRNENYSFGLLTHYPEIFSPPPQG